MALRIFHVGRLAGVAAAATVVALLGAPRAARAATATTTHSLQLDLNSVTVQAFDAAGQPRWGGAAHTGRLVLGADADALLSDVLVDGIPRPFGGHLTGLAGEIRLAGGAVTGGELTVTAAAGPDLVPQTYTVTIAPTDGADVFAGAPFALAELTAGGRFSGATFAGAHVAPFYAAAPLDGAFLLSNFAPDVRGYSPVANLELFAEATVPEPAATAALGGAAAMAFLARRRRREPSA